LKIRLVFYDWNNKSVYNTEKGVELSAGDFHSGSTFEATIECPYDEEDLKQALKEGYNPVFYIVE
jgi:hypothetical protein